MRSILGVRWFCIGLAAAGFLCGAIALPFPARAEENAPLLSPADVWRGYDPQALPLEVASIKTWTEGDIAFEKLRFTAETAGGVPVRVLAIQGSPESAERMPGILH